VTGYAAMRGAQLSSMMPVASRRMSVTTAERISDPVQPRLLEKNTNTGKSVYPARPV
jgi:hypothetical protein